MGSPGSAAPRRFALVLLTSVLSNLVRALDVDVCASENTATTARNISIYQSNGLCHDQCVSSYAFAVTSTSGCWCSDYFPDKASQVDASKCNYPCPGYPLEFCGGLSSGVEYFGYIQLNLIPPSGTASSPSSTTSSTSATSSSSSSQTVQVTASTSSSTATSTSPAVPTISEMLTTSNSSTPHTSSSTSTSTSTNVQTITDSSGAVRTVTVIPTLPVSAGAAKARSSSFSSGAIAGVVIGAILAVLIAAGGIFFLWRRHKIRDDYEDDPSIRGSSSAMMGSTHPDMSMTGDSVHSPGSVGNRNSTIQIDPRMDPFKQGLYLRTNSHESLNTLRDEHDYSRRIQPPKILRATNPDPDDV